MTADRRIAIAVPSTGEEEWLALRGPLETGWLTQGPQVAEFERAFAARHQVAHALAVTSCTTGLHLALAALGIGPGDEVIVPAFTWVASANVVVHAGATPVFVDVDPVTFNLDPAGLGAALSPRTRAVMVVHLFGLCADVDAVRSAVPSEVVIIEDAACAAGAGYKGLPAGGLGAVASFSFHPRKSITTGEGGMVTTNDPDTAAAADRLRNHGATISEETRHLGPAPYLLPDFDEVGFNYRMTDLQGAVGVVQLAKLDGFVAERDRWAKWYATALADIPWLTVPEVADGYHHAWQAYVTVVDERAPIPRNEIMQRLHDRGVATRPGTHAVTDLGAYRARGIDPERFPVARRLARQTMAIPLHNRMDSEDFAYVASCLHEL